MTLIMTGKMYVLYDDFGKLTLKDADSMVLDILINEKVAEDFDYTSSIDSDTYNKIKIGVDNEETGIREIYETQDGATMGQWGVLQKYVKLDDKKGAETIGAAYLKLYNRKSRSLSIKNVMGDIRVRGGSKIPIMLDLGDIALNQQMMVESVTHSFKENEHFMDVTVREWDFLLLTRNVTDYETEISFDNPDILQKIRVWNDPQSEQLLSGKMQFTGKMSHEITMYNALKTGEKVVLLRLNGGGKYLVIDRVVTV